jgi:hypothetical protein
MQRLFCEILQCNLGETLHFFALSPMRMFFRLKIIKLQPRKIFDRIKKEIFTKTLHRRLISTENIMPVLNILVLVDLGKKQEFLAIYF